MRRRMKARHVLLLAGRCQDQTLVMLSMDARCFVLWTDFDAFYGPPEEGGVLAWVAGSANRVYVVIGSR